MIESVARVARCPCAAGRGQMVAGVADSVI